ncbi:MAG: ATP-dependent zinc metalloprotease FtsH [Succinivibrionaceae bacterium]
MAKNIILWLIVAVVIIYGFESVNNTNTRTNTNNYIAFKNEIANDQIRTVQIDGRSITGVKKNGEQFSVIMPMHDSDLLPKLEEKNIATTGVLPEEPSILASILVSWFPIILIVLLWFFFMRSMQGGKGGALGFSKSKAKLLSEDQVRTTFADVSGCDEAKEEVKEIVDYLRDPSKFQKLGGKIPRGVLLVGQPGTGKTLLAKAISGEAKVPFFSISGSDFVEMFVGVGASRVRDMFEQAKKRCPCIIFIDEIDAVGRKRGIGIGGGHDEREQTLNQLLVEMDGFDGHEAVIVIAATNRPDVLDPALLRPGRFDRQVTVGLPDVKGRAEILKVHTRKVPIADDVNIDAIARGTPGFSGAELANLVNEAALAAARGNKKLVGQADFELAKDKILMGPERKSMAMGEHEKENTAYHESGHAIVGKLVPDHDPVYKVSIIPRGRALGVTMYLPENDRFSYSRQHIESMIASLYAGRIAEELIFGKDKVTTGASNDIERATDLARKMVIKWGFSDKVGPMLMEDPQTESYLGNQSSQLSQMSPQSQLIVDEEIKAIIQRNYEKAKQILTDNIDILHAMKDALLKYETIDSDQIDDLLARRPVREPASKIQDTKADNNDKNDNENKDKNDSDKSDIKQESVDSKNSENNAEDLF